MEDVKYVIKKLYPLSKNEKKRAIPEDELLDALAKCLLKRADANLVVKELYERHGRKVPKYGAQALAAPLRRFERLVQEGDPEIIKKCEARGLLEPANVTGQRLVVNARGVPEFNR